MITQSVVSKTRVKWLSNYVKYHNVLFYDSILVLKSELCLGDYQLRDDSYIIQWIVIHSTTLDEVCCTNAESSCGKSRSISGNNVLEPAITLNEHYSFSVFL